MSVTIRGFIHDCYVKLDLLSNNKARYTDRWAGAVMQKPIRIQKCDLPTDTVSFRVACLQLKRGPTNQPMDRQTDISLYIDICEMSATIKSFYYLEHKFVGKH